MRINYNNMISSVVYFDLEGSIQGLNLESRIRSGQVPLRLRMACGIHTSASGKYTRAQTYNALSWI